MAEATQMVDIYIMGKHYQVPEGLTILTALEHCGYRMIRGCGCRSGFCGRYYSAGNPRLFQETRPYPVQQVGNFSCPDPGKAESFSG